jgi:subtilisin family serine protease
MPNDTGGIAMDIHSKRWTGLLLAGLATGAFAGKATVEVDRTLAAHGEVRIIAVLAQDGALDVERADIARRVDALLASLPIGGVRLERRFETVAALALTVDAGGLAALEADGAVAAISLDPGGAGQLLESSPLAQVDHVQELGYSGLGRKVAVIDSGIRLDHQSFAGRVVDQACFCFNCCPNSGSSQFGPGAAGDDHGHGTNVTGIAAGGAGVAGVPAGAAFEARIVAIKALDSSNSYCCVSDIIASLDWLRVNHHDTDVVNLSLGSFDRFPGHCDTAQAWTIALAEVIEGLNVQGTSVTACTANNGSSVDMSAPACIRDVVSVGAVWDSNVGPATVLGCTDATTAADKMTCFANLSPTADLVAPGAWVTAAGRNSPTATSTFAGTSMASPLVAGCLVQLRHAFPGLDREVIEAALLASPAHVTRPPLTQTWPRLDCLDAFGHLDAIFGNGFE